jgi:uncharacterized protein with PIN domain
MPRALVRFHGSLIFFRSRVGPGTLPEGVEYSFDRPPSVKDAIESLGVPHPEVDLVLSAGRPVDLGRIVGLDDEIDVFGIDRPPQFAGMPGLIPPLPDPPRFVLDGHLGRLARYLRLLGFDVRYESHADDPLLARVSASEDRILLTRDRGLLKRGSVKFGYLPRDDDPAEQLREVAGRYGLAERAHAFTRCVRCNGILRPVERAEVLDRLADQPRTLRYFDTFAECPGCGSIYWPGSHFERMRSVLGALLGVDR